MELMDERDEATGKMVYWVIIEGEEPVRFRTPEERDKFLHSKYLAWLARLQSRAMQEALEWLWEQEEERKRLIKLMETEAAEAAFWTLILTRDNYFYSLPQLPVNSMMAAYIVWAAQDYLEMTLDMILVTHRLAPVPPVPGEGNEEQEQRSRSTDDPPRG